MIDNDVIIEVKNLSKSFGSKKVLNNISLEIKRGESIVIIGASGTGKSVFLKNLIGLITPDQGEVFINKQDFYKLSNINKLDVMNRIGVLFQGGALFDSLKIWENVAFALLHNFKFSKERAKEIAIEKLKQVGLNGNVADLYPAELSGGMQKRAALARAIAADPEIILFDEPTSGLDPINTNLINELILECTQKIGATTVTITHDMSSVTKIASRVAMLHGGNIVWQGTQENLYSSGNEFVNQFIHGETKGPIVPV